MDRIFVGSTKETQDELNNERDKEMDGVVETEKGKLLGWNEWAGESIKPRGKETAKLIAKRK